jgi:hypothetical protein
MRNACKVQRACRQGECVRVPLEDREKVGQDAYDGIGAAGVGEGDIDPTKLGRGAKVVFRPIGAGEDLAA